MTYTQHSSSTVAVVLLIYTSFWSRSCYCAIVLSENGCLVNVRTNFGYPSPVPVQSDTHTIMTPDHLGNVHLDVGANMDLYCSSHFDSSKYGTAKVLSIKCLTDRRFQINNFANETIQLDQLNCSAPVKSKVNVIEPNSPADSITRAQIGFALTENLFVSWFNVTFDANQLRSISAQHRVGPGHEHGQTPDARSSFRKDGILQCECNRRYEKTDQRTAICTDILRVSSRTCDRYFDAQRFLARGHLAPAADFAYRAGQRSTFTFANVAPQWQAINNGHWKSVESAVRQFAGNHNRTLDVITGTDGTLQLPNANGQPTDIYLDSTGKIPVPLHFYKIVVDTQMRRAVVFVVINNPLLTPKQVDEMRQMCEDRSHLMEWPRMWFEQTGKKRRRTDRKSIAFIAKGYVYACELASFMSMSGVKVPDFLQTQTYRLLIK